MGWHTTRAYRVGGGGKKEIPFPLLPDFIEAEAIHSLTGMCEH